MTYQECVRFIRILLDSDHEYYCNIQMLESAVNEAQSTLLNILHVSGDERGLRTSYDITFYNTPTNVVAGLTNNVPLSIKCRYPKGLTVNMMSASGNPISLFAQYIEYGRFMNLSARAGHYMQNAVSRFPTSLYWTYSHSYNMADRLDLSVQYIVDSTQPGTTAELSYIAEPPIFSPTQNLVLPLEYHHIVCLLAAELLNAVDVNEFERGTVIDVRQGIQQSFQDLGIL